MARAGRTGYRGGEVVVNASMLLRTVTWPGMAAVKKIENRL
jgi:hypothetical protein